MVKISGAGDSQTVRLLYEGALDNWSRRTFAGADQKLPPHWPLFSRARLCQVTSYCRMDLRSFPFDSQSLSVDLEASASRTSMTFDPCPLSFYQKGPAVTADIEDYELMPDWTMETPLLEIFNDFMFERFAVSFKMHRRWFPYLFKVYLVLGLIAACGFTAYSISLQDEFGSRVSNLLTLLLTMVAFMFVVNTSIPNVPYLTVLHKFVYAGFVLLVGILAQSCVLRSFEPHNSGDWDWYCAVVFAGLWLIFVLQHSVECRRALLRGRGTLQQPHSRLIDYSRYWEVTSSQIQDNRKLNSGSKWEN
jgi:hypothetical protein